MAAAERSTSVAALSMRATSRSSGQPVGSPAAECTASRAPGSTHSAASAGSLLLPMSDTLWLEVEPVARALRGLGLEPRRPRGAGNRYGRL
ncbi:unnamed protein product [Prorocentrum cordatum]|uniref:Uncharacterized protein n=1 Tax=Prorocentrum cordatum TaxID=2364126 RepID=A0ABN9W934_9DINO|nr:unnamed protein product [Polarella glacialis]